MQKKKLREYAKLIAVKGVNIKKRQPVIINAELDQPEFVEMLVDQCYKAGASTVEVRWTHQPLTKYKVRYERQKDLRTVKDWEIERLKHQEKTLPAVIWIISDDPDGLCGINQEKYTKAIQARTMITKPFRDRMDNHYQWCIAAVPGLKWAKKLFPDLTKCQAVEKLWEAILSCSRADGSPIEQWTKHNADISARCERLNSLDLRKLKYRSSNGTDLTVGLIPGSRFCGGGGYTAEGVFYNANIPSEEVFTSPMKGEAEGVVYSTKPLSYQGQLIENFHLVFKDGKVVEYHAEKNEALLGKMLDMDKGARYLGECALVPFDSPINRSGILFYNTLFDENACCHLALGEGYNETLVGFESMTYEECHERGINESLIHEDFMIGTNDLSIIGIDSKGNEIPIFTNGNWSE